MSDYLFADPDGIEKVAAPYDEQAQRFVALSSMLADLRQRYRNSWGNDSYSQSVAPQIQAAILEMQVQVDALGKALGLYHEGLVGTSRSYRDADRSALEAGERWSKSVQPQSEPLVCGIRSEGPVITPVKSEKPVFGIKSERPTIQPGSSLAETRFQDQRTGGKPELLGACVRDEGKPAIVAKSDDLPPKRFYKSVNPNDPSGPLVDPHGAPRQDSFHHVQDSFGPLVDPHGVPDQDSFHHLVEPFGPMVDPHQNIVPLPNVADPYDPNLTGRPEPIVET